uniref:C2H2-type domain-containing protein n=1 Tax=Oryzias latipes TaxID=8090 RepID=A0A3P9JYS6_ORYLA
MSGNRILKQKPHDILKFSVSECCFSDSRNMNFQTDNHCTGLSGAEKSFPSNIAPTESLIACEQNDRSLDKMVKSDAGYYHFKPTSSMLLPAEKENEHIDKFHVQNDEEAKRDLKEDAYPNLSMADNFPGDGIGHCPASIESEEIPSASLVVLDHGLDHIDPTILNEVSDGSGRPCKQNSTSGQDENVIKGREDKGQALTIQKNESSLCKTEISEEKKLPTSSSDCSVEKVDSGDDTKKTKKDASQFLSSLPVNQLSCKDTLQLIDFPLNCNNSNFESSLQLSDHQSNESAPQSNQSFPDNDKGISTLKKGPIEQQPGSQVSTTGESDEDDPNCSDSNSDAAPYFPCHVCGKTFPTSESLEDHQLCHLGEKPHECSECGKCFFQASQLQQHQRMHKSEFQCQICGRGFVSLFALRNHNSRAEHRKSHSRSGDCPSPSTSVGESSQSEKRHYPCKDCNKHFLHASHLKKHRNTHHPAWPQREYACSQCNKSYSSSEHFTAHLKNHVEAADENTSGTPSNTFMCPVCYQCFTGASELISHFSKHPDNSHLKKANQSPSQFYH